MRPRLRLFTGEDTPLDSPAPQVTMTVGEFCRILSHAIHHDRTWLQDFEDEEIQVPEDLFEVMSAYWHLRPGA